MSSRSGARGDDMRCVERRGVVGWFMRWGGVGEVVRE